MKAILNGDLIALNQVKVKQVKAEERTLYKGKWYFNPDNAMIDDSISDKPEGSYKYIDGAWVEVDNQEERLADAYAEELNNTIWGEVKKNKKGKLSNKDLIEVDKKIK